MNCLHAQHLLDSYLDGELPPSLRAEVHAHRLTCPDCQRAMVITDVAGDVIRGDRPEPEMSLSFTDRVIDAIKPPPEPRVARIMQLRRAAAFLGPVLSAAAIWMLVVSVAPPIESVPTPAPLVKADVVVASPAPSVIEAAASSTGSATIADELAKVFISPAMRTLEDTERSTRELALLGRWVFGVSGKSLEPPLQEQTEDAESSVLVQAGSVLMDLLGSQTEAENVDGPDVL